MEFSDISRLASQVLLNTLWQGAIVFVLVSLFFTFNKKANASTRHRIWMIALFAIVVSSCYNAFEVQKITIYSLDYGTLQSENTNIADNDIAQARNVDNQTSEVKSINQNFQFRKTLEGEVEKVTATNSLERIFHNVNNFFTLNDVKLLPLIDKHLNAIIFMIWLGIFPILLIRMFIGYVLVLRICRNAQTIEVRRKNLVNSLLGSCKTTSANQIQAPFVIGFFKPKIIVPEKLMKSLSKKEMKQILLHEYAHIKRKDLWSNVIQKIIDSLLFFNPFIRLISRKLDLEREIACDEFVLTQTKQQKAYASLLLKLAGKTDYRMQSILVTSVFKSSKQISQRIMNIVGLDKNFSTESSLKVTLIFSVIILTSIIHFIYMAPAFTLVEVVTQEKPQSLNEKPKTASADDQAEIKEGIYGMWDISNESRRQVQKYILFLGKKHSTIKYNDEPFMDIFGLEIENNKVQFKFKKNEADWHQAIFDLKEDVMEGTMRPIRNKPYVASLFDNYDFVGIRRQNYEDYLKASSDSTNIITNVYGSSMLKEHNIVDIKDTGFLGTWDLEGEIDGETVSFVLDLKSFAKRPLLLHKISDIPPGPSHGSLASEKFEVPSWIVGAEVEQDTLQFYFSSIGLGGPTTVWIAKFIRDGDNISGGWDADKYLSPNHPVRLTGRKRKK